MRKKNDNTIDTKLTAKEEEVMNVLWKHGPMFVKEIVANMPDPKPHVNTVSTYVRILEQKGVVEHEDMGNSFRYKAVLPKEKMRRKTLGSVLRNYFDNSSKGLVSALVEEEKLTVDDLKELISIIESKNPKN